MAMLMARTMTWVAMEKDTFAILALALAAEGIGPVSETAKKMDSTDSKPFDSFKSKKILHSSLAKPSPSDQASKACSDRSPWSSKTPEKLTNPPRRTRNRKVALSVKEVREVAAKLQSSDQERRRHSDPAASAGPQIGPGVGDAPIGKPKKKVDGPMKLPEKYEILGKFFDSMDSSIRLLRLKGLMATFTNINPKVEYLTDRRFTYGHLSQLKFILPEVIEIEKILVHDERTSCMKPELHVSMNVDAIKNEGKLKSSSVNSHVRKVFRTRLLDFFKAHPEEEIPEGTLPEPFNRSKLDLSTSTSQASSSSLLDETLTDTLVEQQPEAASHLSRSFQKRFSRLLSTNVAAHDNQEQSRISLQPSVHVDQSSYEEPQSISKFSLQPTTYKKCLLPSSSQASAPPPPPPSSHSPATPMKEMGSVKNEEVCSPAGTATIQGTPAKLVLTPAKLMSATPALRPPKRCYMSPDDDSNSFPSKLVKRPVRSRSLKFDTPVKNTKAEDEVNNIGGLSVVNDIFEILPENLLQSIRDKERKALEEKDPAISQAKRRQQMIAGLPKLFDMVHFLFQSIKRYVITKEELLYRITANYLDIVDRGEVEEQLKLLQELVPEWIYQKSASSGDILICINKISSPELMRVRLAEAK